ncbi:hypothetical protein ABUW04_33525 [Streptacidiphilus sp. N1-10]|uniref:LysR substrate-binding domain-containing protein n=1 Tax=Streptacidiphilus jeojiensis TaxID=3229225 RepID=A0ABV6XY37_9ACTN
MELEPPRTVPELPANTALLDFLRQQASPPSGPEDWTLGEWQLHTHPDLEGRLADLTPRERLHSPTLTTRTIRAHQERLHCAYGVPVLCYEGIAVAVAMGMRTLLVRLPALPENLKPGEPVPPLTDRDWQSVDPWQGHLITAEGNRRLTGLLRGAIAAARETLR